jgi:restriction system protein
MKLKMAENSLFAVLLRSPWWASVAVGAGIAALARVLLPPDYRLVGMLTALPFLAIAAIAGWKTLRAPSATRVAATLEAAAALSWRDFSAALEEAFRRDGYAVTRPERPGADLELTKEGRRSLVCARRWKAANCGVEPLRELHAAGEAREAGERIYVTIGAISDSARRFAGEKRIRLLQGAELAQLLRGVVGAGKPAA